MTITQQIATTAMVVSAVVAGATNSAILSAISACLMVGLLLTMK